jgi:hypothetical protein
VFQAQVCQHSAACATLRPRPRHYPRQSERDDNPNCTLCSPLCRQHPNSKHQPISNCSKQTEVPQMSYLARAVRLSGPSSPALCRPCHSPAQAPALPPTVRRKSQQHLFAALPQTTYKQAPVSSCSEQTSVPQMSYLAQAVHWSSPDSPALCRLCHPPAQAPALPQISTAAAPPSALLVTGQIALT